MAGSPTNLRNEHLTKSIDSLRRRLITDVRLRVFTVPGLYNSDFEHWQSYWEREFPQIQRITQKDWNTPDCRDWVEEIDRSIRNVDLSHVVLVAHSLGCATVIHWAEIFHRSILGALLVAPSDVDAPGFPTGTTGFLPMPLEHLPFRSLVVASSNDPYVTIDRARLFANSWGSEYVEINDAGHINASSRLGMWDVGLALLEHLLISVQR